MPPVASFLLAVSGSPSPSTALRRLRKGGRPLYLGEPAGVVLQTDGISRRVAVRGGARSQIGYGARLPLLSQRAVQRFRIYFLATALRCFDKSFNRRKKVRS